VWDVTKSPPSMSQTRKPSREIYTRCSFKVSNSFTRRTKTESSWCAAVSDSRNRSELIERRTA